MRTPLGHMFQMEIEDENLGMHTVVKPWCFTNAKAKNLDTKHLFHGVHNFPINVYL